MAETGLGGPPPPGGVMRVAASAELSAAASGAGRLRAAPRGAAYPGDRRGGVACCADAALPPMPEYSEGSWSVGARQATSGRNGGA